jgi:hypothetical protein
MAHQAAGRAGRGQAIQGKRKDGLAEGPIRRDISAAKHWQTSYGRTFKI